MDAAKIQRINELARKKKSGQALTAEEQREQQALRQEYIRSVLGDLEGQLANTYLVDEQGKARKLRRKGETT